MKRHRKIQNRLIIFVLASVISVIMISVVFSTSYFSHIFRDLVVEDYVAMLSKTAAHTRYLQQEVAQFAKIIVSDLEIQQLVNNDASSVSEDYARRNLVSKRLRDYRTMKDYIVGIDLLLADGSTYTSRNANWEGILSATNQDWIDEFKRSGKQSGFTNRHVSFALMNIPSDTVTYVLTFNNYLDIVPQFGMLLLYLDMQHFERDLFSNLSDCNWGVLLSSDGSVLCGMGDYEAGAAQLKDDDVQPPHGFTILRNHEFEDGWSLAISMPDRLLNDRVFFIYSFYALLLCLSVAAICIAVVPVVVSITRPIQQLTQMVQRVSEGDMGAYAPGGNSDEIAILTDAFNRMLEKLREKMARIVSDEKIKTNLRIDLMMAQINPHFIYNTLNSVVYLASMGKNQEVVELTRRFIKLLQENLHVDEAGTRSTVRAELEGVRDYAAIQQYRYPDRFELCMDVDEAALDVGVPRMLLQPLVENALFHGVLPNVRFGSISVIVRMDHASLYLEVRDDGIGMDEPTLKRYCSQGARTGTAHMYSIGLYNIRERLILLYGNAYALEVSSRPGAGTSVHITIPRQASDSISASI